MIQLIRDWALILAILCGIVSYFLFESLPLSLSTHIAANNIVAVLQPALIFAMLFLTFCRIDTHSLRMKRWHLWLLLIQGGLFMAIGAVLIAMPHNTLRVILEGSMIMLICPTATAAAVITRKLGGNVSDITTYTILINLLAAILIPIFVPLVHPNPSLDILQSGLLILGKVFPLLLFPLVTAVLVKRFLPAVSGKLATYQDLSFYLWAISLSIAIAVTTRSIVHYQHGIMTQLGLVIASLICCAFQFIAGRKIGSFYDAKITAGQALGQKNTVVAIWMGYTFFSPITAIAGGFYSIWHNVVNTVQLYHASHPHKK